MKSTKFMGGGANTRAAQQHLKCDLKIGKCHNLTENE